MHEHARITVSLSQDEFEALRNSAFRDYRNPRDQARFILRSVLLGADRANVDRLSVADLTPAPHTPATLHSP